MSTHADPDGFATIRAASHSHACPEAGCPGAECYAGEIDGCGHPTKSAEMGDPACPWGRWPCGDASTRLAEVLRQQDANRTCDNWRDSCHGDPEIDECVCISRRLAARRRVLALIATEAPGQDVAGVFVIDDALRIDFVSGCALLVGADGTLSWERVG